MVLAFVVALQLESFRALMGRIGHLTCMLALFVPFYFACFMAWRVQRRARVAYHKCQGRLCTACLYDLRGLGDRGTCPECQSPFDVVEDQHMWMRAQLWPKSLEK